MVTKELLDAEKAYVQSLELPEGFQPNRSVPDFMQEAADLITTAERDKAELNGVNIDRAKVARLEPAIEVLRDAQTIWRDDWHDRSEAREEWKMEYPKVVNLKNDLINTVEFVYHDNPEKLKRVAEIREGNDRMDTIQDLHDLAYMGKQDPAAFEAINYSIEKFDQAEAYSNSLMLLLSKINGDDDNDHKEFRDKAFMNLSNLVQYVQRYGKYVFRDDPERREDYQRKYV